MTIDRLSTALSYVRTVLSTVAALTVGILIGWGALSQYATTIPVDAAAGLPALSAFIGFGGGLVGVVLVTGALILALHIARIALNVVHPDSALLCAREYMAASLLILGSVITMAQIGPRFIPMSEQYLPALSAAGAGSPAQSAVAGGAVAAIGSLWLSREVAMALYSAGVSWPLLAAVTGRLPVRDPDGYTTTRETINTYRKDFDHPDVVSVRQKRPKMTSFDPKFEAAHTDMDEVVVVEDDAESPDVHELKVKERKLKTFLEQNQNAEIVDTTLKGDSHSTRQSQTRQQSQTASSRSRSDTRGKELQKQASSNSPSTNTRSGEESTGDQQQNSPETGNKPAQQSSSSESSAPSNTSLEAADDGGNQRPSTSKSNSKADTHEPHEPRNPGTDPDERDDDPDVTFDEIAEKSEFDWRIGGEVSFSDVGGMQDLKDKTSDIIIKPFTTKREKADHFELGVPNVLLYGPPGTGKTHFAKALATETGYPYLIASGSDVTSKLVNESSERVSQLFDEAEFIAEQFGGCLIFMDELDAVVPARGGSSNQNQHAEDDKVVNEFLARLSDLHDHVVFIGSTNNREKIDDAIKRNGRIDEDFKVSMPDYESRQAILETTLAEKPHRVPDEDVEWLAEHTDGASAADLNTMVDNAARIAGLQKDKSHITFEDCHEALKETTFTEESV
ncbi:ATPase family associated with various cellular activities (AAA) [Halorientalis persicus]|uniref:ATPase family associated with various cellular activities (AAA) n=1 Tax=Halorientalis persicus TaxID=1367881 RepID=A0A1H8WLH7_9EURY|nr:ATPase family associated with various cellular activities (AAA) [Halorientalis persicus]